MPNELCKGIVPADRLDFPIMFASGTKMRQTFMDQYLYTNMENDKNFELPEGFFRQFKNGKEFNNFFQQMFKQGIQELLAAELDDHLGYERGDPNGIGSGNSRNGFGTKVLKTKLGEIEIQVPRDRNSSFEPQLIPKRKTIVDEIEETVISLYAKGMTVRDIESQIKELYGVKISDSSVSNLTERILDSVASWQNRLLEEVYYVVWLDGIHFKVRQEGRIITKAVYIVIGLNKDGKKDVLGIWINENESAAFWLKVLEDLKARGVEDILIACTDNLPGLTQAIEAAFTKSIHQICVVHQIRNSLKLVYWKEKKDFVADMRKIYSAPTFETAEAELLNFENKWSDKYPQAVKSWKKNWDKLTPFFDYSTEIRKMIYTTNIIENLNRGIRKYTKNRTIFPDDQSVKKAVFLAVQNASRNWTQPMRNWPLLVNQFSIKFGEERCRL